MKYVSITNNDPDLVSWVKSIAIRAATEPNWEGLCILRNAFLRERACAISDDELQVLCNFLKDVGKQFLNKTPKNLETARITVREVIIDCQNRGLLIGIKGQKVKAKESHISRVVTAGWFINNNLTELFRNRYSDVDEEGLDKLARHLQSSENKKEIEAELTGPIKSYYYDWAFVTKTEEIQSLTIAELLTLLGKDVSKLTHWIEIQYPIEFAARLVLTKPTCISAEFNPLFRPNNKNKNDWGFTVRTDTLMDGVPEAVHEKCNIGRDDGFILSYRGKNAKTPSFERWKELFKHD